VARAEAALHDGLGRLGVVALLVLAVGLARGWAPLVPVAIALACGSYGAELAIDDRALDTAAPLLAAAALVAAELAYWSLAERDRVTSEPGEPWRHAAFVAVLGLGALLLGSLLLALADAVHARRPQPSL
jgi:hypothetical protein